MSIPVFTVVPSSLRPLTFSQDMDDLLSKLNPWTEALNAKGSAFALGVSATSTTLLALGTGIKSLVVQPAKGFVPGMDIVIASVAAPTDRMLCTVTSYDVATGALVADAYSSTGAGSASVWAISMTAAVDAAAFVTPDGTQTLTNKTLASPDLAGVPTAPTAAPGANTTQVANTAFVTAALSDKAPLASPAFAGTPTAPTAAPGTNTTQVASTAYVRAAITALINSSPGALDTLNELAAALGDDANFAATMTSALAAKAPLASPALTGTPNAPTAAASTNTTQIATTAFVQQERAAGRILATAQGAIAKGRAVVINDNGTISQVSSVDTTGSLSAEQTFDAAAITAIHRIYSIPGTSTVVMAYDSKIVAGTVGMSSVTWGTPIAFSYGATVDFVWHEEQSALGVFYSNGSTLLGAAATLAGNDISLGAPTSFSGGASVCARAAYNQHQNRILVGTANPGSSTGFFLFLCTMEAGVVTQLGVITPAWYSSSNVRRVPYLVNIPGTPRVLVVSAPDSSSYGDRLTAGVITINANALSVGAKTVVVSGATSFSNPCALLPSAVAGTFVFYAYGGKGYSVLTVSGTTVTASTSTSMSSMSALPANLLDVDFDAGKGVYAVASHNNTTDKYGTVYQVRLEGSTLVVGDGTVFNTVTTDMSAVRYVDGNDKLLLAFRDIGDSNYGHNRVWDSGDSSTNAGAWVGLADAAIADGAQGSVSVKGGLHAGQTELTPGYTYYVDDTGQLQQSGSRVAGRALSATTILLTGDA